VNVVYLTSDLLFSSRVVSLARTAGVSVSVVNSRDEACRRAAESGAAMLLVDLDHREADMRQLAAELSHLEPRPRTVAYASHVKEQLLAAASEAGCDLVLSRGQFDRQIAGLLGSLAGKSQQPPTGREPSAG
jgi:CheY-like chemotaxis protein